jgi:thiol-disulfide isomerase/thioredoxin
VGDLALVYRLLLAAVFAVAAVGKLADRDGARDAMRGFGVPVALTGSVAVVLPATEIAIAAALIVPATAWWAAVAALVLLLTFAAAIAINVRHGRTTPCHCLGRLHTAPTGPSTLVRTSALAALAGAVVARGHAHATSDPLAVGLGLALLATLAAGAAAFTALVAQNGRLLVRLEALEHQLGSRATARGAGVGDGLSVGAPAPAFAIDDLDGTSRTLDDLRATGRPVVVLFIDPNCGPCRALRPDIATWQREHAGALEIVVLERRRDVADAYDAHATPTAVLVHADGTIASPPAIGAPAIADLIEQTAGGPTLTARSLAA